MPSLGFHHHDHSQCIEETMTSAVELCRRDKLKFTAQRRRVLEILLDEHRALGAYEILEVLAREGLGAQPPVVYRALDFLVKNGLAHRIERLNAYVACTHVDSKHAPAFLICRHCKTVSEADTSLATWRVGLFAEVKGFKIERVVVEAEGLCPACSEAA
ncbi:MAG: transcriptional repressor [Pseudomonadota bacterium]